MSKLLFLTDVETLRTCPRQHIDESAVAGGHNADRATVLKYFNDSLADRAAIPLVGSPPCGAIEGRGDSGIPA